MRPALRLGSATDAMRYWPETGTAVAARRRGSEGCDIAPPFGLDNLFELVVQLTPHFRVEKRTIYKDRIRTKGWLEYWPLLTRAEG